MTTIAIQTSRMVSTCAAARRYCPDDRGRPDAEPHRAEPEEQPGHAVRTVRRRWPGGGA